MSQPQHQQPSFIQFKGWDKAVKQFFIDMGLTQTLRGFENDILVLNPDWEASRVPAAMAKFVRSLVSMNTTSHSEQGMEMDVDSGVEEKKLSYVRLANGNKAQSQTSINKSISQFIARNRARNDASNRAEFLHRLDEIRASVAVTSPEIDTSEWSSCARADMKTIDRDTQMKYDIAKNEDGPLKRTMKGVEAPIVSDEVQLKGNKAGIAVPGSTEGDVAMSLTPGRHPALDERLCNIEKHVAVRYVPSPPKSFLDRLGFLEDHLIRLEKDYPPWAALHFNQPHRGWPPPPRSTPIIVPPHMRSVASSAATPTPAATNAASSYPVTQTIASASAALPETGGGSRSVSTPAGGSRTKHSTSSLRKAVLEKLEIVQAMNDLAGGNGAARP